MTRIENLLFAVQKALAGVLMLVAFVGVAIMVPVRYFDLALPDLTEASITAIACLTFLCVGLLVRTGGHIAIEVAGLLPSRSARFLVRQLANAGILLFVAVLGVHAIELLFASVRSGEASIALDIPLAVPFGTLAVGLVMAAFHTAMNVVRDVRVLRTPGAEFDGHLAEEEAAS